MKKYINICFLVSLLVFVFTLNIYVTNAQFGSCSEYGIMAIESGGYCKCMSGYVMQDNAFGSGSQCVSGSSVCSSKLGYGSTYDSYSGSCKCSYGYVLGEDSIGRTQCISENDACKNQLGYNSRATYGGKCECSYGYIIDGGQCKDGDQVCRNDNGYNSSYNTLSNRCECDSGFTLDDDNQCVKKQNNVYFRLLDINPDDDKELIIKSDYDSRQYKVKVGIGCLNSSLQRYEGKNLVVNLGTDYDVDTFDTVVLQDHSQTCSIISRERTYDDTFPEPEEEDYSWYTPPIKKVTSVPTDNNIITTPDTTETKPVTKSKMSEDEISKLISDALDKQTKEKLEVEDVSSTNTKEQIETTDTANDFLPKNESSFFFKLWVFVKGWFQ